MTIHPRRLEDIQPAALVTAREHLEEITAELRHEPRIAIDTESNGFYAYQERVCLLQISSACEDFVVDPIAFQDLSSLGPLMADPSIEKVFHAGEYDIFCLKRDYDFAFANVFDTMIASRLLGAKELGLAAAISRHFGVTLSKKLQRADWGRRPLTDEQLRYAQLDTHYLLPLSDILKPLLREKKRQDDAIEAFARLAASQPALKVFDPDGFWRLKGRHRLSVRQIAVLKELYLLREHQAKVLDRAPFRVMPETLLLRLAEEMPENPEALSRLRGMTPYLMRKFGHAVLTAISSGRTAEPPVEPARGGRRSSHKELRLFEDLRQWRKTQAGREGVEPVVILDTESLCQLSRAAGKQDPLIILSDLKRRRYGEALKNLLRPKT